MDIFNLITLALAWFCAGFIVGGLLVLKTVTKSIRELNEGFTEWTAVMVDFSNNVTNILEKK